MTRARLVGTTLMGLVLSATMAWTQAYVPPSTFQGDGATYLSVQSGGIGAGWTTKQATPGQCLYCHGPGGDEAPLEVSYLLTGHKNMLKKVQPNQVWANSHGMLQSSYFILDEPPTSSDACGSLIGWKPGGHSLYISASSFNWPKGLLTVGPFSNSCLQVGGNDINVGGVGAPVYRQGTHRNILYEFGGWVNPAALDAIFDGGFTGEQWPAGNYGCARCHTTGYRWHDTATEPSYLGKHISAMSFSRIPTDYACTTGQANYAACVKAGGTAVTASWALDGVQCERCHGPNHGDRPRFEDATALCIQCHREENVSVGTSLGTGSITPGWTLADGNWTDLIAYDGGVCADGVSPDYGTCTAAGQTWLAAPFYDHESGPSFLNGSHGMYSGTLSLQQQDSTDMTVLYQPSGYHSRFVGRGGEERRDAESQLNLGCTGCHNPHRSLVASKASAFYRRCKDCHAQASPGIQQVGYSHITTNHNYTTASTPYGVSNGDESTACAVCHMATYGGVSAAPGTYHFFRISTNANYSTFPTAQQIYAAGGQMLPNLDNGLSSGTAYGSQPDAAWLDVTLSCGQCHNAGGVGPTFSKQQMATYALSMHSVPVIHAYASPNGTISPAGTTWAASGGTETYQIAANTGHTIQSVTVDGVVQGISGQSATYTFTNVTGPHHIQVVFR